MDTYLTPAQAQDKGYAAAQRGTDLDAAETRFLRRYGADRLEDWTDGWNMHAVGLETEERRWVALSNHSTMGRSSTTVECPFCRAAVVTYTWSLAGGGKRCDCGAKLDAYGMAKKSVPRNS